MKDEYPKLENKLNIADDFPFPSPGEWRAIVEADLKGVPFEKKLITKTYEGLDLKPIYTQEDTKDLKLSEFPGSGDMRRGFGFSGYFKNNWLITAETSQPMAEDANKELLEGLNSGATAVSVVPDSVTKSGRDADYARPGETGADGVSISGYSSVKRLINGISPDIPVFMNCGYNNIPLLSYFNTVRNGTGSISGILKGSIEADPMSWLAKTGSLPFPAATAVKYLKCSLNWAKENNPGLRTTGVDTTPYHNAGASAAQELAIAVSTAVYYINSLIDLGVKPADTISSIRFTFSSGNNFFMEVAKFRAFRVLFRNLLDAYGVDPSEALPFVSARTSEFYYSRYDIHNNILRATTQAFAAVLGGAESITVVPFDSVSGGKSELGRRIAKNLQVILNEESKLSRVIDFAGGSYFIESLTSELALRSWYIFRTYEAEGGIHERIQSGKLQAELEEIMNLRISDAAKRKTSVIGTNVYSNVKEAAFTGYKADLNEIYKKRADYLKIYRIAGDTSRHKTVIKKLEKLASDPDENLVTTATEAASEGATIGEISQHLISGKTQPVSVTPLKIRRLSEDFEKLRDRIAMHKTQKNEHPAVYLMNYGTVKTFKARADFAKGFFETGGFNIIYPDGTNDIGLISSEAAASEAKILVLCSTDEEYEQVIPLLLPVLKKTSPDKVVVLAGYPKEKAADHKSSGIDEFIFLGCDAVNILSTIMDRSGVVNNE